MIARTLMIQGTASSVGKSLMVAGLCRLLQRHGLRVAPFKSQNMALNAFVTESGGEIGRAQAVQAEAARVTATVDMNPVLLKPEGDSRSQVVVLGRSLGSMSAREYHDHKPALQSLIAESLMRLREAHDIVVIEGAGSPAEINLRDRDIVNMHVARIGDAPVLLVGDIDRGGVFAAIVGTMELLEPDDRSRIAGFVINKFRGDLGLLKSGLDFLEHRTGLPVVGVVPYVPQLRIADEDSVSLESRRTRGRARADQLEIAVICLPRISNYDDFQPLEYEPGIVVRFVDRPEDIASPDLVVIPGTKSTIADLLWLRESGIATALIQRARCGAPILGVCGGFQLLGERIDDPGHVESCESSVPGLGLLPVRTHFESAKTTSRVVARSLGRGFFVDETAQFCFRGYEIHMGRVANAPESASAAFEITRGNGCEGRVADGSVSENGATVGTMVHGLFDDEPLRAAVVRALWRRRGVPAPLLAATRRPTNDDEYDRLASILRDSLDLDRLGSLVGASLR